MTRWEETLHTATMSPGLSEPCGVRGVIPPDFGILIINPNLGADYAHLIITKLPLQIFIPSYGPDDEVSIVKPHRICLCFACVCTRQDNSQIHISCYAAAFLKTHTFTDEVSRPIGSDKFHTIESIKGARNKES